MLFSKKTINDKNFETMKKNNDSYILIFSSNFCPHCKTVENFFKNFSKKEGDKYENITIFKVEGEKSPRMLKQFNIRSFPTTFFVKNHNLTGVIVGADSLASFLKELEVFALHKKEGFFKKIKKWIERLDQ